MPETSPRDYTRLLARLDPPPFFGLHQRMQAAADACWDALGGRPVSWIGFYLKTPASDQLVLGPRRDKPACSPIGLSGVCGRSFLRRRIVIVDDVASLGDAYIPCDPHDKSELVIPLFDSDSRCWGVLDADSHQSAAFDEADARALAAALEHARLTGPQPHADILHL